jgi:hypothetical protein
LLLGGTDIYLLDDDRRTDPWFSYNAPSSCTGILNRVRLENQEHYQRGSSGTGTNNSAAFAQEVLNWFGTPP